MDDLQSTKKPTFHLEAYAQIPPTECQLILCYPLVNGWMSLSLLDRKRSSLYFLPYATPFWAARNKKIFEQKEVKLQLIYNRASNAVRPVEISPTQTPVAQQNPSHLISHWSPPLVGTFKISVDVANSGGTWWEIGILVRDNSGEVFAAAALQIPCLPDPSLAEAMGIRSAINFALETNFDTVIIESDRKAVTDLFSANNIPHSYTGLMVLDCISLSSSFKSFQISHIRRGGNMCAHYLAKFACSHPDSYWVEDVPACIAPILAMDNCPRPI
ncbi:Ribonuclease H-like superfamily [Sesbania bispinosa]|nr:Ribonuclease H-like superfamily [Sesbania bispinosa]